ncbi:cell adhesion molecule 3 isoform X3 [Lates japonicus]|uniref:Cell adhesion molecule 3 isoform X3 n=1 Tax=Lates japonicus TaxID=270547 RepID=A0AAD3R0U3_LATJO|nr:cell adhesion molecule 3 isoform X3 [Lates japonicus]
MPEPALRDNRIQLHRSTSTELSITIADVQLSDEGEYTCSIFTMPVRTARATVTVLGVPGKPQISGFENAVQEGGKVTLTCTSTGSKPPATLKWYRGDQELQGRLDVVEPVQDNPTYTVSSELTLEVSRNDDNALITCVVDHASLAPGDKRSEQALRVLYSPNVEIHPESDLPREGEKFYLQCLGNGNPEPTSYLWEKKDGELPPLAKADSAFLRFEMLNKSDNGVYLCQANNGIGVSKGEYTLLVQDPMDPDAPDTTFPSSSDSPSSPPSSPPDVSSGTSSDSASSSSSASSSFSPDLTSASSSSPTPSEADMSTTSSDSSSPTTLSNALFPDLPFSPDSHSSPATPPPSSTSSAPSTATPSSSSPSSSSPPSYSSPSSSSSLTPSVSVRLNGVYTFTVPEEGQASRCSWVLSAFLDADSRIYGLIPKSRLVSMPLSHLPRPAGGVFDFSVRVCHSELHPTPPHSPTSSLLCSRLRLASGWLLSCPFTSLTG